jgi:tetratricopeptide (TPR) repeat protein
MIDFKPLKDRVTCFECKKEIVSPDRGPVHNCPHCGTWIPGVMWMQDNDVKHISDSLEACDMNRTAIAFIEARKFDEAIKTCDNGLAINSVDSSLWNNKGVALSSLEQYEEAIKCYNKAISIKANEGDPWRNKGAALIALGRSAEAIKCIDQTLTINVQDANAWLAKGLALSNLGQTEEAINCYKKADTLGFAAAKIALSHYKGNSPASGQAKKPRWKFW